MHRAVPLIWLLVVALAGAQFASVMAAGGRCCQGGESQSDNCCAVSEVSTGITDGSEAARGDHPPCCAALESGLSDPAPGTPGDTPHDHDPERHPCKCPAQCCVVSKAPVTFTMLPSFDASTGHAPLLAHEWREPLPNPTLDRLKRPPRTRATA
ncbi:MAG: hypothetical protein ACF8R9_03290 [Phycisphaerales bacterium JB054]